MTREEILAMQPGREFDAMVHIAIGKQCVFIAREPSVVTFGEGPLGFTCNFGGGVFTADREWLVDDWLDEETNREVPHYSTSIADAWAVIEEMERRNWLADIYRSEAKWIAEFNHPRHRQSSDADTAPEGICKAALLCLEASRPH